MNRSEWLNRDARAVWHPFTPNPHLGPRTVLEKAAGSYVYDIDGKRYFDATSSWWTNVHGHCHPRLAETLARQAAEMDQVLFSPHSHRVGIELSEMLLEKLGARFSQVFYSDDGSTAVEAALKMAIQFWVHAGEPERVKFLSIDEAYHGDTLGVVGIGGTQAFSEPFAHFQKPNFRSTVPYCYRCPVGRTYPDCAIGCLDETEARLVREHSQIAALVVEPLVLGAAGMITYPTEYVARLVRLARRYGLLVIFDEVFTGFGRTGTFFAMEQLPADCLPDIVCLSKGLTAGTIALGATVVSPRVRESFNGPGRTFYHGHTFTGNPIACAVARESLRLFDEQRTIEANQKLIQIFKDAIPRFNALAIVGEVRHRGMIWALEIVDDKTTKARPVPANGRGWAVAQRLWERGIWIRPLHNVIYVVPPYCTTETELRSVLDMLYFELTNEIQIQHP